MGTPEEFQELMAQVRAGSTEAAQTLFERYARHLLRAIRRKLHQPLRTRFDSHDFVQDVWTAFYAAQMQHRHFDTPAGLRALLIEVARNKVTGAYRDQTQSQKRQAARECSLEKVLGRNAVPGPPATPSQAVMAEEQWEQLLAKQPPRYRTMLQLLRQGHTHEEIAVRLQVSTKSIQRLLRRIDPRLAS